MAFVQPFWLLLLPLLLLIRYGFLRRNSKHPGASSITFSAAALPHKSWRSAVRSRLPWLRWIALSLLCIAMARPQRRWQEEKIKADAIDIMLAMDISPSMLTKDFNPDRLAVAKSVAADFVEKRPYDRIGLVAFSAEAFTQSPLTTDKKVVQSFIQELTIGRLEDGTAIGMGLATALNRLKDSPSKSRIVILLTDGEDNVPNSPIRPPQAIAMAEALGVRVYTVGIGTEGVAMSPYNRNLDGSYVFRPRYMGFNTELLQEIAQKTQGKYYRAYSEKDLAEIYGEIDRLEKTRVEVSTLKRTKDYFGIFIAFAALLLLIELLLRWGVMRSLTVE